MNLSDLCPECREIVRQARVAGGKKGAAGRAKALSPERRREIARLASAASQEARRRRKEIPDDTY